MVFKLYHSHISLNMLLKLYHHLSGNEICYYLLLKSQLNENDLKVKSILSRNGKYKIKDTSDLEEGVEISIGLILLLFGHIL